MRPRAYRTYKATFHRATFHGPPASDHPAPPGAHPQPRQRASGSAVLQAGSRPPDSGGWKRLVHT